MRAWRPRARLILGASLLFFAGCLAKGQDQLDVTETLPSTAIVKASWHMGNGFVIDQNERLLLTSRFVTGTQEDVEVLFPIIENGKAHVKKAPWIEKGPRIKGKVVYSDKQRDVAVVRLASLPEGAGELKLAKDSAEKEAPVQFLGAATRQTYHWAPAAATVQAVGPKQFSFSDQKVNAKVLELSLDGKVAREVSGGPVFNASNEVVGLVAGDPAQKGGQLQCIDVNELRLPLAAAYRTLATHNFEQGNYDRAIALCDKALSLHPRDALTFNERGVAHSMKDQFAKAIDDYTEAIKLDPSLPRAYRNRGSAYYHTGKFTEAVHDCTKAVELDPNYVRAYEVRQEAYKKLNKLREAEADAQTVAALTKKTWKSATTGQPEPTDSKR